MQTHAPTLTLGPRREDVVQPKTLVDFYLGGDFSKLYADLCARPDHYNDRQKLIIQSKYMKQPCHPEPTDEECNGLVMQLTRGTDTEKAHQKILDRLGQRQKAFDIADGAELLGADGKPESTFEDQTFGDIIKII